MNTKIVTLSDRVLLDVDVIEKITIVYGEEGKGTYVVVLE